MGDKPGVGVDAGALSACARCFIAFAARHCARPLVAELWRAPLRFLASAPPPQCCCRFESLHATHRPQRPSCHTLGWRSLAQPTGRPQSLARAPLSTWRASRLQLGGLRAIGCCHLVLPCKGVDVPQTKKCSITNYSVPVTRCSSILDMHESQ
jgi:hypothetical protein